MFEARKIADNGSAVMWGASRDGRFRNLSRRIGPGNACRLAMRYDGRVTLFSSSNSVSALVEPASANVRGARQGAV
jgi:hypothetical protein